MVFILMLILILTGVNTFILVTFLALTSKLFQDKSPSKSLSKEPQGLSRWFPPKELFKEPELVDVAMSKSSYSDMRSNQKLSTDIVLVRDE